MLYQHFATQLQMLKQDESSVSSWVLALSGGLDSRVLLHLLARFKHDNPHYHYKAVYVNHGLSPNAEHWAHCCQTYCQQADIDCFIEKVKLDIKAKGGLEQQARQARYQALQQHINKGDVLLTAHHGSDQVETFLLALKRGSGVTGLTAIPKQRQFFQGQLFRPLLECSREQLHQYAVKHQLDWVEDESNQDTRFDRNFVRQQVMPMLIHRWSHIESAIMRTSQLCAEQENLLNELIEQKRLALQLPSRPFVSSGLSISGLVKEGAAARRAIIRQWLREGVREEGLRKEGLQEQGFTMPSQKQLEAIWHDVALAKDDANPLFIYGQVQIGRYQDALYVMKKTQDISHIRLPWSFDTSLSLPDQLGELHLSPLVDGQQVQENALVIRLPAHIEASKKIMVIFSLEEMNINAERIKPDTRQHHRSFKKLLQEYQVPPWQRRRIPLLIDAEDQQLIAATGLFTTTLYSAASTTARTSTVRAVNERLYQLVWYKNKQVVNYQLADI